MPGSTPPTSQLDWLISTTTMIVLSWSKATRDLLKSLGWGIRALHQLATATMVPSPRWREQDSNPRSPLGEEREYEILRQDREIASRSTAAWRGFVRPVHQLPGRSAILRDLRVIPFIAPAPLQLRHDQIDKIGKS